MPVDSTFNDTDSSSDETKDPPSSSVGGASAPPKPPRPARRPGAFARVPMPDAFRPPSSGLPASSEDAAPPSPASGVPDADRGPAFPLTAYQSKTSSANEGPARAFSSAASERAPSPPITPWNDVPALTGASAPPVGIEADASDSSPPVGFEPEDDEREQAEQTIVGQVPRRLLEMSSAGDENTRAYTAPQELIELARRKREERLKAKAAPTDANVRETERPPARRRPLESIPEESFEGVMPDDEDTPVPGRTYAGFDTDTAPPIARPASGPPEHEAKARVSSSPAPQRAISSAPRTPPASSAPRTPTSDAPSTPISLVAKAVAPAAPRVANSMLDRTQGAEAAAPPASAPPQSEMADSAVAPFSVQKSSWGVSRWLLLIGLFIALGVALARWRGLERFFLH